MTDEELAIAAALAGAKVVKSMYGKAQDRFDKGLGDFATAADIAAEQAIVELLRAARPDDGILGEESGHAAGAANDRLWLVDPLCGTLNYAVQTTLVSVNVALRTYAGVSVAAVADPFADEVFWTDGDRAHVRRDGTDEMLRPSAESRLVDLNLDPPFPTFPTARLLAEAGFAERFRPRVLSTTLAVAWVAAGRRAAYVTDGDLRDSVHFAAGIALCQAAGCVVTDLAGRPVHTGSAGLLAAADAETHEALLALVTGV